MIEPVEITWGGGLDKLDHRRKLDHRCKLDHRRTLDLRREVR